MSIAEASPAAASALCARMRLDRAMQTINDLRKVIEGGHSIDPDCSRVNAVFRRADRLLGELEEVVRNALRSWIPARETISCSETSDDVTEAISVAVLGARHLTG